MATYTARDGRRRKFDVAAKKWLEEERWDGRNHISLATGSQWEHETLYLTKSGRFVLHQSSQWQGSTPSWDEIGVEEAADWFNRAWEVPPTGQDIREGKQPKTAPARHALARLADALDGTNDDLTDED